MIVQSLAHGFGQPRGRCDRRRRRPLPGLALLPTGMPTTNSRAWPTRAFAACASPLAQPRPAGTWSSGLHAPAFARVGMHLQVHLQTSEMLHAMAEPLARSAVPVVIDHMARASMRPWADAAMDFQALRWR